MSCTHFMPCTHAMPCTHSRLPMGIAWHSHHSDYVTGREECRSQIVSTRSLSMDQNKEPSGRRAQRSSVGLLSARSTKRQSHHHTTYPWPQPRLHSRLAFGRDSGGNRSLTMLVMSGGAY